LRAATISYRSSDMPVCDIVRTALNATEIKRMGLIQKLNAES
jgi:hypothetical protein